MVECSVSQGNRWCDYSFSIRAHELDKRHKDNVTKKVSTMQKESDAKDKEQQQASRALQQIEADGYSTHHQEYHYDKSTGLYYALNSGIYYSDGYQAEAHMYYMNTCCLHYFCKLIQTPASSILTVLEIGLLKKRRTDMCLLSSQCRSVHNLSPDARPFQPLSASHIVLVQWTPSVQGWYKINFDGSVYNDGSRRASIGGVIRDCIGSVVLAFAERTEHSTVGIVEVRAMIRGLQLAQELSLDRVVAEGDDLVLVQLLRGEEMQTRIPVATQEATVELLRCFPGCDVQHVCREGNQVVHTLCRQAYHGPGVWEGGRMPLPSAVWEKVEEDRNGVLHVRTIVRAAS